MKTASRPFKNNTGNATAPIHEVKLKGEKGEQEELQQSLKRLKLYSSEYAYRAFSGKKIREVISTGSTPEIAGIKGMYCCLIDDPYDQKGGIRADDENDIFSHIDYFCAQENTNIGHIAVYNKKDLTEDVHPVYTFKNPAKKKDALVAIVKIVFPMDTSSTFFHS